MTWNQLTSLGSKFWKDAAISADGQTIYAGSLNTFHRSFDGGDNWSTSAIGIEYLACSSDGTKVIRSPSIGRINRSTNSGASFSDLPNSDPDQDRVWGAIASSANGTVLVGAANNFGSGDYIYISTDSGSTWNTSTGAGSRWWFSLSISDDGTKMIAGYVNGYAVFTINTGSSWTVTNIPGKYVAISGDGTTMLAASGSTGYLQISTDSGSNWSQLTSAGSKNWGKLSLSQDGSKIVASVNSGYIYTSNDGGSSWTEHSDAGSYTWNAARNSSDGTTVVILPINSYAYTASVFDAPPTIDTGISFSNVTENSITVNWGAASDSVTSQANLQYKLVKATSYNSVDTIGEVDAISGQDLIMDWTANTLTANATGLSAGTTYYFAVLVKDEADNKVLYTPMSQATTVVDTSGPTPGNSGTITSSSVLDTSLTLNWTKATDDTDIQGDLQYLAYYSENSTLDSVSEVEANGTAVGSYSTDINTKDVTGLNDSTTYYFNVIVKDTSDNKSVYTKLEQTTSDATGPTPGNSGTITTSSVTDASLTLNWTKATDNIDAEASLQYLAYYSENSTLDSVSEVEANGTAVGSYSTDINTKDITGLSSGTTYYFNVIVKDTSGNKSTYTKKTQATLDTTAPTPGNSGTITTSSVADTSLTLNWTKATDDIDAEASLQYLAYYSENSTLDSVANIEANGTAVGSYSTDINTKDITGLSSGTTYYFNVIVKDTSGNKAAYTKKTQVTTSTLDTTAPTPGNSGIIVASNVTATSMTLNWTKATDNTDSQSNLQYLLYYSTSVMGGTVSTVEATGTPVGSYTTDINTKNVTGLTSGITYYFTVIVKDTSGNKAVYIERNQPTTSSSIESPTDYTSGINTIGDGTTATVNAATTVEGGAELTLDGDQTNINAPTTVKNGSKLTIDVPKLSNISFGQNGSIIVEPGGTLDIDPNDGRSVTVKPSTRLVIRRTR